MRPLLLLVVLVSACTPAAPSAPSPAALSGTWNLRNLRPASGIEQAKPAGAVYSITIENGRVAARADCNTCTGNATLASSTLTLGPALACTRAACATATFESAFTTILSGDHAAVVSDGSLTLSSARGLMRFER